MKPAMLVCMIVLFGMSACEPKSPEKPQKPPLPSSAAATQAPDPRPALIAHIDAGGKQIRYSAYFDGPQLTEIKETAGAANDDVSEYHYRGARLFKYTHAAPAADATLVELDDHGRVQRALAGSRALAAAEIDAIRTRAQLLRSHALAQQASRSHMQ